jgi:hypothetical protein
MHDTIPVHELQLRISTRLAHGTAKAQPGNRPLRTRQENDYLLIDLDRVNTWEVVEIA